MQGNETTARANANVALVKYWGKRDAKLNLPATGSVSLTLDELGVETSVAFGVTATDVFELDGAPAADEVARRLLDFVDLVRADLDERVPVRVRTRAFMPMGAGLASSAAVFAALALATTRAAGLQLEPRELSALARRGSGSAARSIFGGFAEWHRGERSDGMDSVAEPLEFGGDWEVCMVVAIVSTVPKAVSSRAGMQHAATSPFYTPWVEGAAADLAEAREAIRAHDLEALGRVAEHNALKMHAVGLGARPALLYWKGATVECLRRVWSLRDGGVSAYVTIDAGPQVKVLCTPATSEQVVVALREVPGVQRVLVCRPGPGARLVA